LSEFSAESLQKALVVHERYAQQVFELDEQVTAIIAKLKDRGLVSPYMRNFVVARVNPLRWIKDEPPPLPEVLKTMRERLSRFNVEKVNQQDLAKAGGGAAEPE
jgi:ParB family chromosome partitioning protein